MHNLEEETAHLSEEDFRSVMVKKMNAITQALIKLDEKVQVFQTQTVDSLKNEFYGKIRNNEETWNKKLTRLEMDYRIFKAKVAGGVVALAAVLETVKHFIGGN